ncbi:MAG: fibronectin type III domain-containing protein, partial [Patescibacteria group bacterium]
TTQVWQTKAAWGGSSGVAITGLSANTAYAVGVIARNNPGTATSSSSTTIRYTHVNTPTQTIGSITSTQLAITIGENSNPAGTAYALQIGSNYVQANGTVSAGAFYQTAATWGSGTATGLTPSTTYIIQVIAKNGDNDTTSGAATSSTTYTLVATPTQTLSNIATTSMSVSIGTATNASVAQYSVKFNTLYVQANGTLGASQIWQTNAAWTSLFSVTGLTPSTSYTVQIIARNENNDSTNGTSSGTTNSTLVDSNISQTLNNITSTGMSVTIGTATNPSTTEYSIQLGSSYVQANGTLAGGQIWQTA